MSVSAARSIDADEATFTALATPPWRHTRTLARGTVLLIGDTTETDFGIRRSVQGLGPTGAGYGLGCLRHSSRMVEAGRGEILGLAGQERFDRQPVPKHENSYQQRQRSRESEVGGRVVELVGPPAKGVRFVHVFERGADNLDVFCHCRAQRTDGGVPSLIGGPRRSEPASFRLPPLGGEGRGGGGLAERPSRAHRPPP